MLREVGQRTGLLQWRGIFRSDRSDRSKWITSRSGPKYSGRTETKRTFSSFLSEMSGRFGKMESSFCIDAHLVLVLSLLLSFLTQMIRKSVETRDWLNTIEPRNVRAVMKRIVEDVTAIDTQVGQLYEEGVRKAHSSGLSSEKPTVRV